MKIIGITLGPILETISESRKIYEIANASAFFSTFMYEFLKKVADSKKYEIITPYFEYKEENKLYPDRAILKIENSDENEKIVNEIEEFKDAAFNKFLEKIKNFEAKNDTLKDFENINEIIKKNENKDYKDNSEKQINLLKEYINFNTILMDIEKSEEIKDIFSKLDGIELIKNFPIQYNEKEISYEFESMPFENYNIKFDNVSFYYEEDKPVLKNISFEAKQGTATALVGSSGSGKTTVTNLIARFWDSQSGNVTIGGIDIRKIYPEELLTNISMIFQDVYLVNDTVENNIKLGNPDASREEVIEAAKNAHCHDFITELENGYDTIIGEGGSTLSGGEKQRISIARALLKNTPIILLDEATASLDADNEHEIRNSLDKLTKNKTVITIAHKLNTIKNYDQIIVMSDGIIEEIGNHEKLMKNKGRYYIMYTEMRKAQSEGCSLI